MAVKYYNIKCKKIITKYLKDGSLKVPQNEPSVVEGCGLPEVNGTYKKVGISRYNKRGQLDGKNCTFRITRSYFESWFIFVLRAKKDALYYCRAAGNSETPPENGWSAHGGGVLPAPSVRTLPLQIVTYHCRL